MPAAIIPFVAGELLGATVANAVMGEIAATTFLFGTQITGQMVASAAVSMLVGGVMNGSGGRNSQIETPVFTAEVSERMHIVRSNVANRGTVYGRSVTSGPLVFAASSESNNKLHIVIALANHEVDEIEEVYLNDEPASLSKFDNLVTIYKHYGTADQAADSNLIDANVGWTADHRLRGVAYIYVQLKYDRTVFARGIPNIKALVRGKKLHDPRTGLTKWSDNIALVVRDYLKSSDGLESSDAEIDDSYIISQANICDERITLTGVGYSFQADTSGNSIYAVDSATTPLPLSPGMKVTVSTDGALPAGLSAGDYYVCKGMKNRFGLATTLEDAISGVAVDITDAGSGTHTVTTKEEARYTCNGTVDSGTTPRSIMEGLLSAGAGVVTWPAGKWTLNVAAYESPSVDLGVDDFAGPIKVRARVPRQRLFNAVKGTFADPAKYWQAGDFPAVRNSTYASQDGAEIFKDLSLPYTISGTTSQRLAKILVEKSRQGITAEFQAKLTAFKLQVWQNVRLTLPQLGWDHKVFKVTGWGFREEGIVTLTLQEEAAGCYAWSEEETTYDFAPNSNLPDPFTVPSPASLFLESGTSQLIFQSDGYVISRIKATWPAPSDPTIIIAEIQAKTSADSVWQTISRTAADAGSVWLTPVQDGAIYNVRVRYENTLAIQSDWREASPHTVVGKTDPPSDVTGLHISVAGPNLGMLVWDIAPDVDVVYGGNLVIRHTPLLAGATWDGSFEIAKAPGNSSRINVPLLSGTYLAKWLDSTGHMSMNAALVVTNMADLMALNFVLDQAEHPAWSGIKSHVVVDTGKLTLDLTGGTVEPCGTYAVPRIDLGAAYLCRLSANIPTLAYSMSSTVDDRSGYVDSWASIDGAVRDMVDVQLWVRSTPDAPSIVGSWSDFQPHPISADIYGRAFDFELRIYSYAGDQNVYIEEMTITVDTPDRIERGTDVSYTSGTLSITFDRPYFAVPAIGITGQGMAVGDSYLLTSKSTTGFSIRFRNSGGSDVARTFDWFATGY